MNSYQKTEALLFDYSKYKLGVSIKRKFSRHIEVNTLTEDCISSIDEALKSLQDEKYIKIIEMYYFDRRTLEYIAEELDVSVKTVSVQRKMLINKLKAILFSDEYIMELLKK